MEIALGITILLAVLFIFTTINLLVKNEKAEDIIVSQNDFIASFQNRIIFTNQKLSEIDNKGLFESDDEIGWFFTEIKNLNETLSQYQSEKINETKNSQEKI